MMNYPLNKPGVPGAAIPGSPIAHQPLAPQGFTPMQPTVGGMVPPATSGGLMPPVYPGSPYPMMPGMMPGMVPGAMPGMMMMQGMVAEDPAAAPTLPGQMPLEQSYIENILRLNLGKIATIYMTFENNREWNAKIFKGRVEAAGRDHIIISDPSTGMRYLLLMVNLDYITFDEELTYFPAGHAAFGTPGR